MENNIKSASAILKREHLVKILRVFEYFMSKDNRDEFENKEYSYSFIGKKFQLNVAEMEALLEYVYTYSNKIKEKAICDLIFRAKEHNETKNKKRTDKNYSFLNDERIEEIDKIISKNLPVAIETNNKIQKISDKEFVILKNKLFDEIYKRIARELDNFKNEIINSPINQVSKHEAPPLLSTDEKNLSVEESKKTTISNENFNPNRYLNNNSEENIEAPQKTEDTTIDTTIEDALTEDHDYQELGEKIQKTSKKSKKKTTILILFILIVAGFFLTLYILFGSAVEPKQQPTLKLPDNFSTSVDSNTSALFINDEEENQKTTIKTISKDINNKDKLNQIIENQRKLEEKKNTTEELIKKQEQELVELKAIKEQALKKQYKKERINRYSTTDIENAKIKENGFSINQDFFRVGDKLGKFTVLAISDKFIDVFNNEEGYPFKIYINKDK